MRRRLSWAWRAGALVSVSMAMSASADAATQAQHLAGHEGVELFDGTHARARTYEWHRVPRSARAGWGRLQAEVGSSMRATWDASTGVPSRIWGAGVHVAGSVSSPALAASFARAFLARHIDLLAPGCAPSDFVLVSNDLSDGMRTLGFVQESAGVPVLGGQVSFRFKADRLFMIGSEAAVGAVATTPVPKVSAAVLGAAARSWLLSDVAVSAHVTAVEGPFVLPLQSGSVRHATVMRVTLDAEPIGRWWVYVDAETGAPVAREQRLRFATGTVLYDVPMRRPGAERAAYPAMFTAMTVAGADVVSDGEGRVSWGDGTVSVTTGVTGDYVRVNNTAGAAAVTTLSLAPNGSAVWSDAGSEFGDAQLTTFIHTNNVMAYARRFAGDLPYLDELLVANVNINNSCNAFYDGTTINFYREAGSCGNTGRLADVVYHEFGHALHDHGILPGVGAFDGAASEGLSDYLAATITGDSGMGRGFFNSAAPLREIDPSDKEHRWPEDIAEIHYTGLIISGALWDMRKALIASLGETEGVEVADRIFYQAMRRAVDIPTMYLEALAADDDDGDLTNGTPHICEIDAGFAPHGLVVITSLGTHLSVAPPHQDGYQLSMAVSGVFHACNSGSHSAEVEWRLREDPSVGGSLPMTLGPTGFEATIPQQPDGTVVQFRVHASFDDGADITFPTNEADPFYELFIGHVEPIYCTDFETDPFAEGWTHGLESGEPTEGADDWMWGASMAPPGSGDPSRAFSGDHVIGNDLGGGNFNGLYQANKVNYAETPVIDTSAYEHVRLQYRRWLTVEDHRFDRATVYANGAPVWANLESVGGDVDHVDEEWRFSDVELSDAAAVGSVVLRFELASDGGATFGGWTMDDVCVVGYVPTICGDGLVTGLEPCDDGVGNSDTAPDACRTDCVPAACGDGVVDSGESCDDGNVLDGDGCDAACGVEGDGGVGGAGGGSANDDELGLEGNACGCRVVGASERPLPRPWWALVAVAFAARRRQRRD